MMTPNSSKPWYKSKTVLFNTLVTVGAVLGGAVGLLPVLQPFLSAKFFAYTTVVIGLANIALRSVTKHAVHIVEKDPS